MRKLIVTFLDGETNIFEPITNGKIIHKISGEWIEILHYHRMGGIGASIVTNLAVYNRAAIVGVTYE